jgi:hypothetical protein
MRTVADLVIAKEVGQLMKAKLGKKGKKSLAIMEEVDMAMVRLTLRSSKFND